MPKRPLPADPTTALVKKQRAARTWLDFVDALEAVVGKYSAANACTEKFAKEVKDAVVHRLTEDELADAQKHWAAGNSITACGRKVGDRAVVRAAICVLLSDMTKIEVSSTAQAKLWAAFPGGPDELLARLGPDPERPFAEGKIILKEAINACGRQDERIKRIHRVLNADKEESMERLLKMTYTEASAVLMAINGFGPKLTACVLSFTCNHPVLAVDTNVSQVVKKLGWVRPGESDPSIHKKLNGTGTDEGFVPCAVGKHVNLRATLHGLLLNLGQQLGKKAKHSKLRDDCHAFVAEWQGWRPSLS